MSVVPGPIAQAAGMAQYNAAYQLSPIILVNGIVTGESPLTTMLPPAASDGTPFATFLPVPGGTLISQAIGMYPFANQQVAANATIQQPLTISLVMIVPVNQEAGYRSKAANLTSLQSTLEKHNNSGGMYHVATPAYTYSYCVMTAMTDMTGEESRQKQIEWQLDFIQPILTLAQAQAAENQLLTKITNGNQINGQPSWSGP